MQNNVRECTQTVAVHVVVGSLAATGLTVTWTAADLEAEKRKEYT